MPTDKDPVRTREQILREMELRRRAEELAARRERVELDAVRDAVDECILAVEGLAPLPGVSPDKVKAEAARRIVDALQPFAKGCAVVRNAVVCNGCKARRLVFADGRTACEVMHDFTAAAAAYGQACENADDAVRETSILEERLDALRRGELADLENRIESARAYLADCTAAKVSAAKQYNAAARKWLGRDAVQ